MLRSAQTAHAVGATYEDNSSGDHANPLSSSSTPRMAMPPNSSAKNLSTSPNTSASPLQIFVKAKKKINELYKEVEEYVDSASQFLGASSTHTCRDPNKPLLDDAGRNKVEDHRRKAAAIQDVLLRDHMKVVFFGRTSNGKSTAVNALLGDKILPMGIGHTTSCFMQVEGGEDDEPYITVEGREGERRDVQSLAQLGNALCAENLGPSTKVKIVWPREKCKMLDQEVILIDSPGIDVETDLDEWIDKFCLDADVFVLVANAESTLMLTEKKFFHKVSERLSNPNVFIVHNRSDAFAGEDMQSEVRQQHMERAVKFLTEELSLCKREEADDRIFFVSAKEALQARMQEARGQRPQIPTEDFFPRYLEFQNFEKQFASCLSHAAVKTKFGQHTQRGREIISQVSAIMAAVNQEAMLQHKEESVLKKELWDKCDFTEKQLELMTLEMKEKIQQITEDVEYKVGKAMSEEIRRLSVLVDEFSDPFHPDPLVLNVYKSKINNHVENGVGSNLKARLSADLQLNMESHQQEMIERMTALLPVDRQQIGRNILPRREAFEVLYHLHCDNLCSDFQEDLRFKFSMGFTSLVNRFLGAGKKRSSQLQHHLDESSAMGSIPRGRLSPIAPTNEFIVPQDDWSLVSKVAVASLTSQGTMGGLLVGGLLLKTVGWRVLAVTGAVYGSLYLYERATWTTQAKCREFKRQYVEHAARKLRLIVDMTSANCSHQVQQELSSVFARLCHLVDETTADMREDIRGIDRALKDLEEAAARSKVLKNQASFIANKLELFEQTYLSDSE